MLVNVRRLPEEPIVIATMKGRIGEADLLSMFEQSMALCEGLPGPIFRITDALDATIDFSELVLVLRDMSRKRPGTSADPRFRPLLVGTNPDATLVVESMMQHQYGEIEMKLFIDLESAIEYARAQVSA